MALCRCCKLDRNRSSQFWETCDQILENRKFGGGAILAWGIPPYGVRTPDLTLARYSAWDFVKAGFRMVGIGPHLREIREFENWRFGLENCRFCPICPARLLKLKVGFLTSRRHSRDPQPVSRCWNLELNRNTGFRETFDRSWKKTSFVVFRRTCVKCDIWPSISRRAN